MEDPYNMDLTTPDAYVRNHGVDVGEEKTSPQYGQVKVRIRHNSYQSTVAQMGKEQAVELRDKLSALLAELDRVISVGSEVRILTTAHDDLRGKIGRVEHVFESGNLQVGVNGSSSVVLAADWVEVV